MTISFDVEINSDLCTFEAEVESWYEGHERFASCSNYTVWLGGADITEDVDPDLLSTLTETALEMA